MKILYAIQGTGNGHLTRSLSVIKELQKYADIDILISGTQYQINVSNPIAYRFKGLGYIVGESGQINYFDTIRNFNFKRFYSEAKEIAIKQYDLVVSDYEPLSVIAASRANIPTIGLSNQVALFHKEVSRPKQIISCRKLIMKYYAVCNYNIGLHYNAIGKNIETPIIRDEIRHGNNIDKGFGIVYLPFFSDENIYKILNNIKNIEWVVFSKRIRQRYRKENVLFELINSESFTEKLLSCHIVLTAAGFETTSEALFLGKKMVVVPLKWHFEQAVNSLALEKLGVSILNTFNNFKSVSLIESIIRSDKNIRIYFPNNLTNICSKIIEFYNKGDIK